MSEAVVSIRMTEPLLRDASQQAERTGVSIEHWLLSVIAERVREDQVSERFFKRSSDKTDGQRMLDILDAVPDGPPMPGDELPEGYVSPKSK